MTKSEIKELTDAIAEKERRCTFLEQYAAALMALIEGNTEQVLTVNSGDYDFDGWCAERFEELREKMKQYGPRVKVECGMTAAEQIAALKNKIDDLHKEYERLKHRNLWQRIINR